MKICIVAGEASGDQHAAAVLRELKRAVPEIEAFGFGGDSLSREGMEVLVHSRELAIVGLFNVLRHVPRYRRWMRELLNEIERRQPDAVMFVDFPDFNLRTARKLQGKGIPLLYYISPQVWAWRSGRARMIEDLIDHLMVLFPFEVDCYDSERLDVTFVGHPVVDRLGGLIDEQDRVYPGDRWKVALLPGSRRMEIGYLLPEMLGAVRELRKEYDLEVVLIRADTVDTETVLNAAPDLEEIVTIIDDDGGETLSGCDLAIASSGTVTLEAAVLGIPTIVLYRLPALTYRLARLLVGLDQYSLVNIVAGREVVPELMQGRATAAHVVEQAEKMMQKSEYERVARDLAEVRHKLGKGGAARRVAKIVIEEARA